MQTLRNPHNPIFRPPQPSQPELQTPATLTTRPADPRNPQTRATLTTSGTLTSEILPGDSPLSPISSAPALPGRALPVRARSPGRALPVRARAPHTRKAKYTLLSCLEQPQLGRWICMVTTYSTQEVDDSVCCNERQCKGHRSSASFRQ